MSYFEKTQDIYNYIHKGKALDAFEKYYGENVVMIEGTGERFEGKDTNRKREQEFFGSVKEIHGAGVTGMTANEEAGVTMVEAWMDITFGDGNRMKMEQVAVQKWEGDFIISERFYYNLG